MDTHEEKQEKRREALRRLGAKIEWLDCATCGKSFLNTANLGGKVWRVMTVGGGKRSSHDYRYPNKHGVYCSEACATVGVQAVKGCSAAWVEGFEP